MVFPNHCGNVFMLNLQFRSANGFNLAIMQIELYNLLHNIQGKWKIQVLILYAYFHFNVQQKVNGYLVILYCHTSPLTTVSASMSALSVHFSFSE